MPQLTKETLKKLEQNKGILDLTEEEKDELVLMTKPGSNNPAEVCLGRVNQALARGYTMGYNPDKRPPKDSSPPTSAKLLEMGKMSVEDARKIVTDYDAAVEANEQAKYNKSRAVGQVSKDNKKSEAAATAKVIAKGETPA
jgi:hypothetical protein